MRYGPFLAAYLKNLVLSVQGAKQDGSADGPATTSGPAAKAGAVNATGAANMAAEIATQDSERLSFMAFLPKISWNLTPTICSNINVGLGCYTTLQISATGWYALRESF